MFNGLNKLIGLKLENCNSFYAYLFLNTEIFSHLKSLKYLEINNFPRDIYDGDKFNLDWLKPLGNLKKLSIRMSKEHLIKYLDCFHQSEFLSKLEYFSLDESN